MKRFWLVLLSLGLVLAFSATAMAVDVKFSGSYYAAGLYQDKYSLVKGGASDNISTAFYYQRFRLQTDFIVAPGLSVVTRFDALERIWGGQRSVDNDATLKNTGNATSRYESENIAFDWAYIKYVSPIGLFTIGYQGAGTWGTSFGDSDINGPPVAKINYTVPIGPVYITAAIQKSQDNSLSAVTNTKATDEDFDKYNLGAIFVVNKDIQVGLIGQYQRIALARAVNSVALTPPPYYFNGNPGFGSAFGLNPYIKAKFGPLAVEAELTYAWGKIKWEDNGIGPYSAGDMAIENITAYVNAVADFGMVYVGGTGAYVSGDDPGTDDKMEGGFLDGGKDFNPTLIMFNFERNYWVGGMPGGQSVLNGTGLPGGTTNTNSPMTNAWFLQGKVGVRPIPALDINASLSWAVADKKPAYGPYVRSAMAESGLPASMQDGTLKNEYGWEVDVTATYKITNNLSYMLGAGYLFTGDYFKGAKVMSYGPYSGGSAEVRDNFLIINKLTLTF